MTRLNVYAGPAGFYLIRGGPAATTPCSTRAPARGEPARSGSAGERQVPAEQAVPRDRDRDPGSLVQRRRLALLPGHAASSSTGSWPTTSRTATFSPIWNPEFFGNTIIANGNTWPFLEVEQRRYRFRLLNGCQSRFLILDFSSIPGVEVWAIGNEGGFLAAPVNLTAEHGNRLLMGLAERADVIVDFTQRARREPRPRERRPRRAVRRRRPRCGLRARRPGDDRPGPAVPSRACGRARRLDPAAIPPVAARSPRCPPRRARDSSH